MCARIVTERNPNDLRQTVRTSIEQPVAARYRFRDASLELRDLPRGATAWKLRNHDPGDLVHDGIVHGVSKPNPDARSTSTHGHNCKHELELDSIIITLGAHFFGDFDPMVSMRTVAKDTTF